MNKHQLSYLLDIRIYHLNLTYKKNRAILNKGQTARVKQVNKTYKNQVLGKRREEVEVYSFL